MQKFELVLLIHGHQPVGNFDDVFERAYQNSYLPFVEVLARHPAIRLGLHYSGPLLEWIERAHPGIFRPPARLGAARPSGNRRRRILRAHPGHHSAGRSPRADHAAGGLLEKHFEARPSGAWLAERVWEPQLPSSLAPAGVEYTLVDDNHFLGAGFEPEQLYGYYLCEDLGHTVKVLPGLKTLRYLIPFRDVKETTDFLRDAASNASRAASRPWATTWKNSASGPARTSTATATAGSTASSRRSKKIPTGWDFHARRCGRLAPAARPRRSADGFLHGNDGVVAAHAGAERYHGLVEEFSSRPDVLPFLRGGIWRGFFSKYAESNLMHKKMLHVSERSARSRAAAAATRVSGQARDEAMTLLLQGQCNDAYWHGVFGGLYSPHLRTALWRSLEQAEDDRRWACASQKATTPKSRSSISMPTDATKSISPRTATPR